MTAIKIPLPADPRPELAPCTGRWDLFDSRRHEDHLQAREICATCPLKADCKPPSTHYVQPLSGAPGRPVEGSAAIADGTWGGVLYRNGIQDLTVTEACPVCGASALAYCTTPAGKIRPPHKARHTPRTCSRCASAPAGTKSPYCRSCSALRRRETQAAYERRRKGAA